MTTSGPPTLDDVAQAAGVSRSTASRAINGGLRVSPEAQAAVDDAVAQLGYAPNRAARTLVTRRTDSIALVVPEPDQRILTDPFLSGILAGVSEGLAETDLQLVLLLARPGEQRGRVGRYLRSGHVDGVIVASHHRGDHLETQLGQAQLPAVFVGRLFEPDPSFSRGLRYVDVDNVTGGRIATQRMIDRGRRRIGTITGPLDMPAGVDRMLGWQDALRDAGLSDDAVVESDFTMAGAVVAAARLLDQHPDLDGIFAASDLMAEATLRVLAERGRSVPGDVSVVGFDDLGIAETTSPRLTTVHNPVVQMVGAATSMLVDLVAGRPVRDERRIFAPRLIEGDSA